jgi:hypothetical protein
MQNSRRTRRIYAPRGTVMKKRIPIGLDPIRLAQHKALDEAENKTDAAYVLEVYLEGQAQRRTDKHVPAGLEAK